jgi:hypothetical protein
MLKTKTKLLKTSRISEKPVGNAISRPETVKTSRKHNLPIRKCNLPTGNTINQPETQKTGRKCLLTP